MVSKRTLRPEVLSASDEEFRKLPFWTKVELSHERNKLKGTSKAHIFCRPLLVFHLSTHLYTGLVYTLPEVYATYDRAGLLLLRSLFLFLVVNCAANFYLTLAHLRLFSRNKRLSGYAMDTINTVNRGDVSETSSTISIITEINLCANRDKHAFVNNETVVNWNNGFNKKSIFGNAICVDMPTNGATGWSYCDECETDVPPRAFHCLYCKGCVLKRDHHCHVLGTCIGFWNQRFFVVGSTYTVVTGIFGAHLCLSFLRASESVTFVGCLLPMTLVNWLLGSKPFLVFLTTIHMYINALFTLLGIGFLATQVRVITQGLTLYEYKKRVHVKCSTSISENLRSVFGDYWALNFVFPFGFFVQQKGNGLTWDGVKFER